MFEKLKDSLETQRETKGLNAVFDRLAPKGGKEGAQPTDLARVPHPRSRTRQSCRRRGCRHERTR
eukprot:1726641-Pleurochrysis_carterae.AAC.1